MFRRCTYSLLSTHDNTPRHSITNFIKKFIHATINAFCNSNRWKKEWSILRPQLWQLPFLIAVHFCHSTATNIAYYTHIQSPALQDIGFILIPDISNNELSYISEYIFLFVFITGILWSLNSLYFLHPLVYVSELWMRTIKVTVVIVILRSLTFLATSLPGPALHCRPSSLEYNPPLNWYKVFFSMDIFNGCGDLLFSSHVSLALSFVTGLHIYLPPIFKTKGYIIMYGIYWPLMIIMGIIIIGARKHYTVDVLVAFYVTPLVYYASYKFYKDVNNVEDFMRWSKKLDMLENNGDEGNEISDTSMVIIDINKSHKGITS